eukprot:scaffold19634_cov80-Skeletonema_marinoi.AAC.1
MRIPFSHTPNYDPASPHSKIQQNSPPPRTTTPHITQNEQTPCSLFPTYAYHHGAVQPVIVPSGESVLC